MGRELGDPHRLHARRDEDHHENVRRGRRHAEPEEDACEHREHEHEQQAPAAEPDDQRAHALCEAGLGEQFDDDPHRREHADQWRHLDAATVQPRDGPPRGCEEGVERGSVDVEVPERDGPDDRENGVHPCRERRIAKHDQRVEQHCERDREMEPLEEDPRLELVRSLGRPAELQHRQVDTDPDAQVEQGGRNQSRADDVDVRHTDDVGHEEGRDAHHRREHLSARTGDGLDGGREVVADPLIAQHRNGEATRRRGVGRRAAGDRSHHHARDHGHLDDPGPKARADLATRIEDEVHQSVGLRDPREHDEDRDPGRANAH